MTLSLASVTRQSAVILVALPILAQSASETELPRREPTRSSRPEFLIVAIGDSLAAGEGNPVTPGDQVRSDEDWGGTNPPSDHPRRCHNSPKAGPAVAAGWLQETFPSIRITFKSFACSGAKIAYREDPPPHRGGLLDEYEGSEVQLRSEPALPPQIDQLSQFIETRDNGKVDALVIAVGINDFGFGELVMDCLSIEPPPPPPLPPFPPPPPLPSSPLDVPEPCNLKEETRERTQGYLARLPGLYARLDDAIDELGPREVLISEYPDPTSDDDGSFCHQQPNDDLFSLFSREETEWTHEVVLPWLNGAIADAAEDHGWELLELGNVFRNHGVCADDRFFNSMTDARAKQGANGTFFELIGIDHQHAGTEILEHFAEPFVSSGALHPNEQGHLVWAELLHDRLARMVRARFDLTSHPPDLRAESVVACLPSRVATGLRLPTAPEPDCRRGGFMLAWTAAESENGFQLQIDRGPAISLREGSTSYTLRASGRHTFRVRECGPLNCSPWSNELYLSNETPRVPPRELHVEQHRLANNDQKLALYWIAGDDRETRFEVRYDSSDSEVTGVEPRNLRRRRERPNRRTRLQGRSNERTMGHGAVVVTSPFELNALSLAALGGPGLIPNTTFTFRVRACSEVGCSPWSPPISKQVEALLSGE